VAVWAISDLHLSFRSGKPMDVFGPRWARHAERMAEAWDDLVNPADTVLVPGDNSWAMKLHEADLDLEWIHQRPGTKVLLKGNHDYWWQSIGKVRAALPSSMLALQNDTVTVGDYRFAGARLWDQPGRRGFSADDEKIYLREIERLKLSISQAQKECAQDGRELLMMTHYPPFNDRREPTPFTELIEASGSDTCIFGHLHGAGAPAKARTGEHNGVTYHLVSCDCLGFTPIKLRD
jgi:predicted phosphohydrolase